MFISETPNTIYFMFSVYNVYLKLYFWKTPQKYIFQFGFSFGVYRKCFLKIHHNQNYSNLKLASTGSNFLLIFVIELHLG